MTTDLIDQQKILGGRRSDGVSVAFVAVRAQRGLVALLLALAALAWWVTINQTAGMQAGPAADLGSLPWFVGVLIVMMAAMMLPSVVGKGLLGAQLAGDGAGRWAAAGTLAAAAVYEVTPLKDACLARCRSPLGFLIGGRHRGSIGALELGSRHAAWCVGCCIALMAALFALGSMSLVWMALVAAIIAAQKTVPWRRSVVYMSASLLLALAVGVAFVAHSVAILAV